MNSLHSKVISLFAVISIFCNYVEAQSVENLGARTLPAINMLLGDSNYELNLSNNGITRDCDAGFDFQVYSDITNNSGTSITILFEPYSFIGGAASDATWYVQDPLGDYNYGRGPYNIENGETFVVVAIKNELNLCVTVPEVDIYIPTSLGEYRVCDGACN